MTNLWSNNFESNSQNFSKQDFCFIGAFNFFMVLNIIHFLLTLPAGLNFHFIFSLETGPKIYISGPFCLCCWKIICVQNFRKVILVMKKLAIAKRPSALNFFANNKILSIS